MNPKNPKNHKTPQSRRLTAFLLTLCVTLSLAACSGGADKKSNADQLTGTIYVPEFIDLTLGTGAENENVYVDSGCCDGKNIYIVASIGLETDTGYEHSYGIYRIEPSGSGAVKLENYVPGYDFSGEDANKGWFNLSDISSGADGTLWVKERATLYSDDESEAEVGKGSEEVEYLRQLDSTGAEQKRIDISGLEEEIGASYIQKMLIDGAGNIVVCYQGNREDGEWTEGIAVLDSDGYLQFSLDGDAWDSILLGNGAVATRYYDRGADGTGTMKIRAIDMEAKDWGAEYPIAASTNGFYNGAGEYLYYYNKGDSLYGYKEGASDGERLFSWSASDINLNDLSFVGFLDDGRIAAMTRNYTEDGAQIEMAVLTATDASKLPPRTVLTYAAMYLSTNTRADIINFNKKSDKYRIEIRDYSEYNTTDDYQAGLTKLNTEIIAGKVPDIMDVSSLPVNRYAAKGYLEDLWPLIDADPEINRSDLMERVFNAAEINGKLYQVFNSFTIQTAVGSYKRLGDKFGWTLSELQAALAEMPEGCTIFGDTDTQSDMLNRFLSMNMGAYLDWEKGESHFDSDNFKGALEFCKSFPADFDWENYNWEDQEDEPSRIMNGRQMLQELNISSFGDLQMYEAMFGGGDALTSVNIEGNYDSETGVYSYTIIGGGGSGGMSYSYGDAGMNNSQRLIPGQYLAYVGYPREDGGVGSSFVINNSCMAISSSCPDKEGAWSFVRQTLLPSIDEEGRDRVSWRYGFPSNKSDFEKMAARAMEKEYMTNSDGTPVLDENGQPVEESKGGYGWGSLNIDILSTSQEEYDQIMRLYNAIDTAAGYDESVFEIVNEQAGAYFAGDRDLDEAVKQIQDRVNLYINENR